MSEGESSNNDPGSLEEFEKTLYGNTDPIKPVVEETPTNDGEDTAAEETEASDDGGESSEEEVNSEETDETDSEEEAPKSKKQTAQERINELTAARREAERDRDELKARLEALEAKVAQPAPQEEKPTLPAAEPNDGRPDPDAEDEEGNPIYAMGKFDPDFIADLTRWSVQNQMAEAEAQRKVQQEEEARIQYQTELQTKWEQKVAATEQDVPDIREKGQNLVNMFQTLDPEYGTYLASTIMELDEGPRVLAYLSDHLDEAERIVDSGPIQSAIALGRLDAQMSTPKKKAATKVSNAPEPPPEPTRGRDGRFSVRDDTDDLAAFERKFYGRE